jgi:histidinol-phosphate/aromatic aminotransferase/cobyric acid decarboxylase-like protein
VGYAIADPALLAPVEAVRPPFNVSGMAAAAAIAAMDDREFLETSRRAFHDEAAFLRDALRGIEGCRLHGGDSNMLLVEVNGVASGSLVEALARRGVLVVDGRTFHGLEHHNTIRVSIRDRQANAALAQALRAAWPELRRGRV